MKTSSLTRGCFFPVPCCKQLTERNHILEFLEIEWFVLDLYTATNLRILRMYYAFLDVPPMYVVGTYIHRTYFDVYIAFTAVALPKEWPDIRHPFSRSRLVLDIDSRNSLDGSNNLQELAVSFWREMFCSNLKDFSHSSTRWVTCLFLTSYSSSFGCNFLSKVHVLLSFIVAAADPSLCSTAATKYPSEASFESRME